MKRFFFLFVLLAISSAAGAGVIVEEIYARVGNEIITKSDYEKALNRIYEDMSRRLQGVELEKQFAEQKSKLLDFLINLKLLDQRARELDISVEEEVDAAVKRLREENGIPDDQALEAALRKEGTSLAQLREDFRRRLVQQKILWNYVQGKVNITEDDIKSYYEQHKPEVITPPVTRVRQYEVIHPQTEKEILSQEARSLVEALRSGADLREQDFPHLKISEAAELMTEELDPRIAKILDETAVGSYTEPIEVPTGWIILKVEERRPAQQIPFEEARGRVYNLILQERAEKYQKTFLEDLRKQTHVVVLYQGS